MKKLEILAFYGLLISIVTAFWALVFKLICPKLVVFAVVFVASITSIISAVLITKCFIEIDKENKAVVNQIQKSLRNL